MPGDVRHAVQPAFGAFERGLRLDEKIEDQRDRLGTHANTVVANGNPDDLIGLAYVDQNFAALRRIFHGVRKDIAEHLCNPYTIADDVERVIWHLGLERMRLFA
jgi:hypothetical protein